jgi:tRNA threonylcarbamoyladenosine biosynthesis protein TsaB
VRQVADIVLVLALESATELSAVALADESGVLARSAPERGRRHGESMAPAIEFVSTSAGLSLRQVDAVVVDVGPGLFTGLRVGVSTAKALGFALDVAVVEVGSLELLALGAATAPGARLGASDREPPLLVPVVDARRAQVFSARFEPAPATNCEPVDRVDEDRLFDPDQLAEDLAAVVEGGRRCLCLGDGALRYRELVASTGAEIAPAPLCDPDVGVLALTGLTRAAAGKGRPAAEVTARYLRPADVRINWEQRLTARPAPAPGS